MNEPQVHRAWAIRLGYGMTGRYNRYMRELRVGRVGPTKQFDTQREARDCLREMKKATAWPRARVERVTVTIAPLP